MKFFMINLNVRTCKQPSGTSICGPCCVKMVIQYFGVKISLRTVKERCRCTSNGSTESSLALAINKMNLKATLYAIPSGGVFFGKYINFSKTKLIGSLNMRAALTKEKSFALSLREAAYLIEQDSVKFELVGRESIERELNKGNLWIACCQYYILDNLQDNEGAESTHFVVIQGYDKKHFIINDPLLGIKRVDKDRLLCSIYSITPYEVSAICIEGI